eukprot:1369768-Pleurochrysis_carterae.AAC.1
MPTQIRPRPPLVPELLDASAAAAPARAPRQPLGQGDLRHHRHQDGGHHLHAPIAQPHQVLEGTARHLGAFSMHFWLTCTLPLDST